MKSAPRQELSEKVIGAGMDTVPETKKHFVNVPLGPLSILQALRVTASIGNNRHFVDAFGFEALANNA
jgi:hypothetical protein